MFLIIENTKYEGTFKPPFAKVKNLNLEKKGADK